MKFFNLKRDNVSGKVISAWRRFTTLKVTITTSGVWVPVNVPKNAAEVVLKSIAEFYYGESDTADGASMKQIQLGVLDMEYIYIKGIAGQEIEITWGLL